MEREEFEEHVQKVFDRLPEKFQSAIENVRIIVEEYPSDELVEKLQLSSRYQLLGLYQGVPLPHRTTWYGTSPVVPDTVTLFRGNLESRSRSREELERQIYETLVHEIGHYFGMTEDEIRAAGY
ncbi:MAG TPA: metallopeptidase family protein [Bacteroidota bacterium]|nr:metallopeptidase family protein [Bacteroidota bacterium]